MNYKHNRETLFPFPPTSHLAVVRDYCIGVLACGADIITSMTYQSNWCVRQIFPCMKVTEFHVREMKGRKKRNIFAR